MDAAMMLPVLALDLQPDDYLVQVGEASPDLILTVLNTMLTGKTHSTTIMIFKGSFN